MSILVNNHTGASQPWADALRSFLPEMLVQIYPHITDPNQVEYAVVWDHPHGDLLNYPNLKAVLMLGAGMDHIDKELTLPTAPIVRLVDPAVGDDMSQYVLYWLMHFQRGYERYRQQAQLKNWQCHESPLSRDYRVTVVGAGTIGQFISKRLAINGFAVSSWSRTQKELENVACFHGDEGLERVMSASDVLVNCLPLTQSSYHFFDQKKLSLLPKGASLINVSRGAVIDDSALINMLDSGHIASAALDAFAIEPLPKDSPLWQRENVFITPHMSGSTYPAWACEVIANNIRRVENGELPFPIYHRETV
jgi:glyoxylate/hydroxypyruvate reductase A